MSELKQRLLSRIAVGGPITIADFMSEALMARHDSYYRHGDPLGAAGDFTTAPEISQMFGELIGAWLAERWQALGQPRRVTLVELGPGRGTLLSDALRATRKVEGWHEALDLRLVEINPTLQRMQARALEAVVPRATPHWHAHLADVPDDDAPLLLVANEFFDALPIRQLQRHDGHWRERLIGADGAALRFVLAPGPAPLSALLPAPLAPPPGAIAEVSPLSLALMQQIARRVCARNGAALIVDYGRSGALGASLQAVAGHRRADPLEAPGQADLSALVDFAALAQVARESGAAVFGPAPQGQFLRALGIDRRAAALKRAGADAATIDAALHRLIDDAQMGTLFKAMAVIDHNQPKPAGFA